jgi:hypothetical protein
VTGALETSVTSEQESTMPAKMSCRHTHHSDLELLLNRQVACRQHAIYGIERGRMVVALAAILANFGFNIVYDVELLL